jgi:predicted AAA+ superfamily ATPase
MSFAPVTMRRLWRMLAHVNGQSVNYSSLAASLDITGTTIKNYIDLHASAYIVEIKPPWFSNMKKRLIKAPKVYIADSGITACLLGLRTYDDVIGHPASGAMWEQIVLSEIRARLPSAEICYYRTAAGSEIDFVVDAGDGLIAVECKLSQSPSLGKGNFNAIEDINPDRTFVVIPKGEAWRMGPKIEAISLDELPERL